MSEVIPKSSKKLNIFVMDRDSAHLQSIRKSFKKLKVKNKVSLQTFQSEETILAAVKKVLDSLSLPPSNDDSSLSPDQHVGCLNPIQLILFELETDSTDGWNLHETIKQMYAQKRDQLRREVKNKKHGTNISILESSDEDPS